MGCGVWGEGCGVWVRGGRGGRGGKGEVGDVYARQYDVVIGDMCDVCIPQQYPLYHYNYNNLANPPTIQTSPE